MADITIDQRSDDAGIDNCSLIFINSPAKLTMPLADPAADGLLGWDESTDEVIFFTAGTGLAFSTTTIGIDSTVATLTGSQTLTNKTLTAPVINSTVTGTFDLTGATITYDTQVVTLTGSQTLTNKTLTAPTINAGALSGDFSGDADFTDAGVQFSGMDEFNIKHSDYGAVGDDATDDTAAFNAAVAAADAAGGGIVYCPPGTYLAAGTNRFLLASRDKVWIKGAGIGKTIFKLADGISTANMTTAPSLFLCNGTAANVFFSDFTIDGNRANQTYTISPTAALQTYNITDGGIFRVEVKAWHSDAAPGTEPVCIHLIDATRSFIRDCYCSDSPETQAWRISGQNIGDTFGCAIQNCYADGCHSGGTMWQVEQGSIIGCTARSSTYSGFDCEDGRGCTIQGCTSEESGLAGIRVSESWDCSVVGNICRNNNQDAGGAGTESGGITLNGVVAGNFTTLRTLVTGNVCYDDQTGLETQNYQIQEYQDADYNYIFGNYGYGSVITDVLVTGANTVRFGTADASTPILATNMDFFISRDDGDGTSSSRAAHINISGETDTTIKLEIGLDTTGSFGLIQAVDESTTWLPVILGQSGGNIGLGALTAPAEKLDVVGNIKNTGYIHMAEMAAPGNPAANTGYLYVADAAATTTLYFKDSAGTATNLLTVGGGLANVVEDVTPQLGAMLDVNTFGFGDGVLELLSFTETGSAVNEFTIANAATGNDPVLSATGDDAAVGITLTPKGTGNITLGTMVLDSDQTIGAGQDNYVLTYDNAGGLISLEASTGGLSNIVEDVTPQLGAALDAQGFDINNGGVVFLTEQAAAEVDVAGKGQFWVKTATPNVAMFTDDAGTDFTLSASYLDVTITAISDNEIIQYNSAGGNWENQTLAEAGIMTNLSDDTTPTLGGALDLGGFDMTNGGVLFLTEQAAAEVDVVGKGQIWVKTATPNQLWWTDDAGTDAQLGLGSSGADVNLSNITATVIPVTLSSDTDITDDLGTGDIRWRDIHAATLNAGLTAADTLILRGRDVDGAAYVDILTITSANTVTADLSATVTIGGNAILDSTWTGSANVVTLGTITTGTWTGTDIAVADGGTGASDAATALANLGGIGSVLADTTPQLGGMLDINGQTIGDGTLALLGFVEDGSSVNYVEIENQATGNGPTIRSVGTDTHINLNLDAKGNGVLVTDGQTVATDANTLTLTNKDISSATNTYRAASLTVTGAVELATAAEINTGTDTTRALPVDQYQASNRNLRYITVSLVEPGTDVAVATDKAFWIAPFPGVVIQDDSFPDQFAAYTRTAGTTGTMVVDIHKNGTTIMTTNKLNIETTELDSTDAATQPDLTTTAFVAGDIFSWDIDAIHTTAAKGLIVTMAVRPT